MILKILQARKAKPEFQANEPWLVKNEGLAQELWLVGHFVARINVVRASGVSFTSHKVNGKQIGAKDFFFQNLR